MDFTLHVEGSDVVLCCVFVVVENYQVDWTSDNKKLGKSQMQTESNKRSILGIDSI